MKKLSPSIMRMEKPLETCAKILNAVGCNSVHIDISLDGSISGFYGKDVMASGEIDLFNCPATIHIFTNKLFKGLGSCKLRKNDVMMLHVFPTANQEQILTLLDDASTRNYKPAVALDIGSDVNIICPFIDRLSAVYVMGIPVATCGLPPDKQTISRLSALRGAIELKNPSCSLGIDGGINEMTFTEIATLADEIVIGGLLFNAPNIYTQWKALNMWLEKTEGGGA